VLVLAEDTGVAWVVQSLASNEGALIVQPIDDVMLKQLVLASATDHPSAYADPPIGIKMPGATSDCSGLTVSGTVQ
jgi:hypothetical protein